MLLGMRGDDIEVGFVTADPVVARDALATVGFVGRLEESVRNRSVAVDPADREGNTRRAECGSSALRLARDEFAGAYSACDTIRKPMWWSW